MKKIMLAVVIGLLLIATAQSAETSKVAKAKGKAQEAPYGLQQIDDALSALEPKIGHYPPDIDSSQERKAIGSQYHKLERDLDQLIKKDPTNTELLLRRGQLHAMGHNLDVSKAWEKAESDLKAVINREPENEKALLTLGSLYVNTNPIYAPTAEKLFLKAQEVHGSTPLEDAHRGLLFAYYYQAKMKQALTEADLLVKMSPDNEIYMKLRDIIAQKVGAQ